MVNKLIIKLKRAYHRWCLKNAIAYHGCKVCIYHPSTNSYTVKNHNSGHKYYVFVDDSGKIMFRWIKYE